MGVVVAKTSSKGWAVILSAQNKGFSAIPVARLLPPRASNMVAFPCGSTEEQRESMPGRRDSARSQEDSMGAQGVKGRGVRSRRDFLGAAAAAQVRARCAWPERIAELSRLYGLVLQGRRDRPAAGRPGESG